jgi:hypothetical protein
METPIERAVALPTGAALAEYDGMCLELANDLLSDHPRGSVLYVECDGSDTGARLGWRYHAAIVLDGIVYDAWHPHVRDTPKNYVEQVFGSGVEWEIFGDDESPEWERLAYTVRRRFRPERTSR